MKLLLPQINNSFDFAQNKVNRLVIENSSEFARVIQKFKNQVDFGESYASLFDDIVEQNFTKLVEIIYSPIEFNINTPLLLNSLHKNLSMETSNEQSFLKTVELKRHIVNYIQDLLYNKDADLLYDDDPDISKVFKMLGVRYNDVYETIVEKLFKFLVASQELGSKEIFLFVNLSDYLSSEEKTTFYKTVLAKNIKIFLIDRNFYERNSLENLTLIDKDLCEL
ncbi:MAG: type II-A CRISPR-associated protein Csn2 [Candidatus Dojkabacteria bacterium]|nr:MAG: type II-A CRISPR-associated protein Csn2 [Candidatus Dojkabacteria bacterium]